MAASVNASVTTLETTEPSVPVSARCAPITSLFMRLISAPVCVRVKNAIGIRCVWSNSVRRSSKISPSPILADHQRSPSDSSASANGERHHEQRERGDHAVVLLRDGGVDDALDEQRRDDADEGLEHDGDEEAEQHRPVGPGEAPDPPDEMPVECAPRTDAGIRAEHVVRAHVAHREEW